MTHNNTTALSSLSHRTFASSLQPTARYCTDTDSARLPYSPASSLQQSRPDPAALRPSSGLGPGTPVTRLRSAPATGLEQHRRPIQALTGVVAALEEHHTVFNRKFQQRQHLGKVTVAPSTTDAFSYCISALRVPEQGIDSVTCSALDSLISPSTTITSILDQTYHYIRQFVTVNIQLKCSIHNSFYSSI
ncbi:hypothetical protein BGZ47_009630 [Haplosporangium gracile]|nr:hypothetical protein BGZ47_009630 [Haplosporangium gracile]